MSGDWLELREHLAAWVDQQIAAEPDREARAVLTFHRERIIDQYELVMMRRLLVSRDAEKPTVPEVIRMNGSKRCIKVGQR